MTSCGEVSQPGFLAAGFLMEDEPFGDSDAHAPDVGRLPIAIDASSTTPRAVMRIVDDAIDHSRQMF